MAKTAKPKQVAQRPVASAIILNCVLTDRRLKWCCTNKTGKHQIPYAPGLVNALMDHMDQRILGMVDVRVQVFRVPGTTKLCWRCTAIRISREQPI